MVIRLITMVVLALAVSTGAWGQTADPQVDELRERVAESAGSAGGLSPAGAARRLEAGRRGGPLRCLGCAVGID